MKKSALVYAGVVAFALFCGVGIARAAEVAVLCAGGYQPAMTELGPQFERASGHKLMVSYGSLGATTAVRLIVE